MGAAGAVDPAQPIVRLEGGDVGEPLLLVALQPHAAPARHLRHLVEREDHHLAISADGRHQFAVDRGHRRRLVGALEVEHLLALARGAEHFVLRHHEAVAAMARHQEFAAALISKRRHHVGVLLDIEIEPHRLAMPAPTRQLRGLQRVELAVAGEDQNLGGGLGREREFQRIVGLEGDARQIADMAAQRPDPALIRHHDGDRLAHHHRLLDRGLVVLGRLGEGGAAFAEIGLRPERRLQFLDLARDGLPLLRGRSDERLGLAALLAQRLFLGADFHLLQPAQIAQPHVEDGVGLHVGKLERLHQHRFRLVLAPDDLDHLVEVEIGDEIAAQHFQAMLDLGQPMLGAAQQHVAPVLEPFKQSLGQAEHLRDAALHQHVHVERDAAFQLGELEQRLHQQFGIDAARARLDHQPHILGRFIAHVGDQRQLLLVDQLGEFLDQARLLHQPGNLRDDDHVSAAAGVFGLPARAHAERAAAGAIGLGDFRRSIDDHAAGREIRSLDVFEQRAAARLRVVDQEQRRVA